MTAITQNIPWFIRSPAVSLIGEKCYISLVENLQIDDIDCLKYSLSKGLGLGIVAGSSIMKVPQIQLIVASSSSRGLSFVSYVLETLGYAITLAYSYRNNFPFSTYGENFALTVQNALILVLIVYYPSTHQLTRSQSSRALPTMTTMALVILSSLCLYSSPENILQLLQASTLPLSLFSKLPQIVQNARARSTGNLSAFAVACQTLGCLARLFTTATEVNDPLLFSAFALALVLNCIVAAQMYIYWGNTDTDLGAGTKVDIHEKEKSWGDVNGRGSKVEVVVPPQSPVQHIAGSTAAVRVNANNVASRLQSPPPSSGGRKWSRKLD